MWDAFGEYMCQRAKAGAHVDPYRPPQPDPTHNLSVGASPYEFFTAAGTAIPASAIPAKPKGAATTEPFSDGMGLSGLMGNMMGGMRKPKEGFYSSGSGGTISSSANNKKAVQETFVYTADGVMASYEEPTKRKTAEPVVEGFCGCAGAGPGAGVGVGGFSVYS